MTEISAKPTPDAAKSLNNINWELKRLTESSNKRLAVEEGTLEVQQGVLNVLQSISDAMGVQLPSNGQNSIKSKVSGLPGHSSKLDQSEIPF